MQTLYFVKQIDSTVSKATVRTVVGECEECQSIDPSPVHWPEGALDVEETWHQVAMDITHYKGAHFLTLIDCGPTLFTIWRRLHQQDAASMISLLKALFCKRGLLAEILMDNDTTFHSSLFKNFLNKWGVQLQFCCAHVPLDNGIIKQCHRTVKRIAARKQCAISDGE